MIRWLLVGVGIFFIAANVWIVVEIHQARQHHEAACRETLAKELRWSSRARTLELPDDPCRAILTIRKGH